MLPRIFTIILLSLLLSSSLFAAPHKKIQHVIYITLDGTRWQEAVKQHRYMPVFWKKYASQCVIYGGPGSTDTMEVAAVPISLPSYQSQMAGAVQPCMNNECGRIRVETLPESLVRQYGFHKKDTAVFASWNIMNHAAEHIEGTVHINDGNLPAFDPDTHQPDIVMNKINQRQIADHPEGMDRFDKYTFAQAVHYLKKYKPKFLWIALQDSDDRAHAGDWAGYVDALAFYDKALDKIFTTLSRLKIGKSTMVIVTTDHGRGKGQNWTTHGEEYPESRKTWAFVYNGELIPDSRNGLVKHYSTLSIKPSVEAVFK